MNEKHSLREWYLADDEQHDKYITTITQNAQ
jgi:hypothetical protein